MKIADLTVGTMYAIEGTSTHTAQPAILLDVSRPVEFRQVASSASVPYAIRDRTNGVKRYLMLVSDEVTFSRIGSDFDYSALTAEALMGEGQFSPLLPRGTYIRCVAPTKIDEPYADFAERRDAEAAATQARLDAVRLARAEREPRFDAVEADLDALGIVARSDRSQAVVKLSLLEIEKLIALAKK